MSVDQEQTGAARHVHAQPCVGQGQRPASQVLALQRAAGNQATSAYVQRGLFDAVLERGPFDGAMLAQADPGLPRTLIQHYMSAGGAELELTRAQMIEVDAWANLFGEFPTVRQVRNRLIDEAVADPAPDHAGKQFTAVINGARGRGAARKNQTLGNFTITLEGTLTVTKGERGCLSEFTGTATYYDVWDFDPKPMATFGDGSSGRTTMGELKTWVGAAMEGDPFTIRSADTVDITQHQFDSSATII